MKLLRITFTIALLLFMNVVFKTNAQDWANLNRFKEENSEIGLPRTNEDRVIFMGNSITQGWKEQVPEFFDNLNYVNRGIGGQTTPQMLIRFRQDVIKLYPKVVVILAGTNDIAGNTGPSTLEMIEDNIYSMAELAKAHNIEVVLCSVLPVFDYPWQTGLEPAKKIIELNARIKKYADTHGIVYADYFTEMVDAQNGLKSEYTNDGVHPTKAGYEVMAPIAEKAIARALILWSRNK
ncbi:MAG: SGNH/GDSL hydrolase family protein [Dysgonamonadaceae bacterium]|jgi:lysophospholipase L1-like esterase|nr:SGNH/GDSL hydrolase family protein [Dysgonamonadaceae bacterium]MDD3356006.1 SGNH/GDSL hydrolase family protein [Dysgonamonadaceae bacterium]MDD3728394.1 SGNH/GDSL hydrolase family protein [Dysgonamonadaceae bacterium]MDD4246519.1 SGNH/GDSL hydrolase family protein [Dysgonamonadaceae bacterium]MDD4605540.1 SGNH/GDSL hydrolase family protein [Dysgonamonadaceae bacterium]